MRILEQNPVAATHMGDHRWDDRLGDNRPEAIAQQDAEMVAALAEFGAMDAADFSLEAQIDHTLLVKILASFVREHEKVQSYRRDPGGYMNEGLSGVMGLLLKEFAPLPERLRSALGRARDTARPGRGPAQRGACGRAPRLGGKRPGALRRPGRPRPRGDYPGRPGWRAGRDRRLPQIHDVRRIARLGGRD